MDGSEKALAKIEEVRSLGLFINKWPTGVFSCVSYSLPGLVAHPTEGGVLDDVMFSTVFRVAHCPWPWTGEGDRMCDGNKVLGMGFEGESSRSFTLKEIPKLAGEEWGAGRWEIREGIYQRWIWLVLKFKVLYTVLYSLLGDYVFRVFYLSPAYEMGRTSVIPGLQMCSYR